MTSERLKRRDFFIATMNHILHKEVIVLLDYSSSLYEIKNTKKL